MTTLPIGLRAASFPEGCATPTPALSVRGKGKQARMRSLTLLYNQTSHSAFLPYPLSPSPAPLFPGFRSPNTQNLTPLATARLLPFQCRATGSGVHLGPSGKCRSVFPRPRCGVRAPSPRAPEPKPGWWGHVTSSSESLGDVPRTGPSQTQATDGCRADELGRSP